MKRRDYYSLRTGKLKDTPELTFQVLKKLFLMSYIQLEEDGYFQKYFGYYCVDQGDVKGELGIDIEAIIFINLRKENLWPVRTKIENYSEDDLFDIIEFLHDHCSQPLSGYYHDWHQCGNHYDTFNDIEGQKAFRDSLNPILKDFKAGFEVSEQGEILILPEHGMDTLLLAEVPSDDTENITQRIESAKLKFRLQKSKLDDRRDAVRELADVLEFLRPQMKNILDSQDENDLFNIANNFGIRHHNSKQKVNYDKAIWYSWLFYYYLSTIHATLRLIARTKSSIAK